MEEQLMYSMEELIPIVSRLTERYTSNDSSSVTYETAQMLMEAVVYCIREASGGGNEVVLANELADPQVMYQAGYEKVLEKTKQALQRFNYLNQIFCDYGNTFLRETLADMGVFFSKYDPRFAPQDHIVFFDYPIRIAQDDLCGIDYVEQYLAHLGAEQLYLKEYPREQIEQILSEYDRGYRDIPINLCEIVKEAMK